jgi:hypothetical protein
MNDWQESIDTTPSRRPLREDDLLMEAKKL